MGSSTITGARSSCFPDGTLPSEPRREVITVVLVVSRLGIIGTEITGGIDAMVINWFRGAILDAFWNVIECWSASKISGNSWDQGMRAKAFIRSELVVD